MCTWSLSLKYVQPFLALNTHNILYLPLGHANVVFENDQLFCIKFLVWCTWPPPPQLLLHHFCGSFWTPPAAAPSPPPPPSLPAATTEVLSGR